MPFARPVRTARTLAARALAALPLVALLGLAAPEAAHAGFGYTYLEGGYGYVDPDGGDGDGGPWVGLSARVRPRLHVFSSYRKIGSGDGFVIGVGGHVPVDAKLHLVGRVGWADLDGDNGLRLEGGFRLRAGAEIDGGLFVSDLDRGSETGAYLGAVAAIHGPLALTGQLRLSDRYTDLTFGLRFSF
jgi:hypothetical protein